jgi:hypothetical protein
MDTEIYILHTKKSVKYSNTTYCIAIMKLNTTYTEFIVGETDNDRIYKLGDKISYVYHAEYYSNMEHVLEAFNNLE